MAKQKTIKEERLLYVKRANKSQYINIKVAFEKCKLNYNCYKKGIRYLSESLLLECDDYDIIIVLQNESEDNEVVFVFNDGYLIKTVIID